MLFICPNLQLLSVFWSKPWEWKATLSYTWKLYNYNKTMKLRLKQMIITSHLKQVKRCALWHIMNLCHLIASKRERDRQRKSKNRVLIRRHIKSGYFLHLNNSVWCRWSPCCQYLSIQSRNKFWSAPCLDGFPESNLISLGVSAQGLGADDAVNSSCLLYCGRAWRKWKWRQSKVR